MPAPTPSPIHEHNLTMATVWRKSSPSICSHAVHTLLASHQPHCILGECCSLYSPCGAIKPFLLPRSPLVQERSMLLENSYLIPSLFALVWATPVDLLHQDELLWFSSFQCPQSNQLKLCVPLRMKMRSRILIMMQDHSRWINWTENKVKVP